LRQWSIPSQPKKDICADNLTPPPPPQKNKKQKTEKENRHTKKQRSCRGTGGDKNFLPPKKYPALFTFPVVRPYPFFLPA